MDKVDIMNNFLEKADMDDSQYIFGIVFIIANRMDTLLERELKEFDITTKQWFLSVVIDNVFSEPPTMKETAKVMGTSHQNAKQVALKLEKKGLIKLEKDKRDARITRLYLTEQSYEFWQKTQPKGTAFTQSVFDGIEKEDLARTRVALNKMLTNLIKMECK